MDASTLPHLNAALNGTAAILLAAGYLAILGGRRTVHRACMLAATAVSGLFLASYLAYHATSPINLFHGTGVLKLAYYAILISHVLLAAAVAPLVPLALWRALTGAFDRHRRIVRWAWPMWMYVSLTGVLVYLFLYAWNPPAP